MIFSIRLFIGDAKLPFRHMISMRARYASPLRPVIFICCRHSHKNHRLFSSQARKCSIPGHIVMLIAPFRFRYILQDIERQIRRQRLSLPRCRWLAYDGIYAEEYLTVSSIGLPASLASRWASFSRHALSLPLCRRWRYFLPCP